MFQISLKVIEYTLLNVLILKLNIYCYRDKFYERSKFGQYDEVKNHAPLKDNQFFDGILKTDVFLYSTFFQLDLHLFLPLLNWWESLLWRMKYSCNKFRQMYKAISIRDWILLGGIKKTEGPCWAERFSKFTRQSAVFHNTMRKKQVESNPYIYTLSKLFLFLGGGVWNISF